MVDTLAEAGMQLFHTPEDAVDDVLFPPFVLLAAMPHGGVGPLCHSRERHEAVDDHRCCPLAGGGRRHIHEAMRPATVSRVILAMLPHVAEVVLPIAGVVDIGEGAGAELDVDCEGRVGVGYRCHTLPVGLGERAVVGYVDKP